MTGPRTGIDRQIAWARAQAAQHQRLAARATAGSMSRTQALNRHRIALDVIATLTRAAADAARGEPTRFGARTAVLYRAMPGTETHAGSRLTFTPDPIEAHP